MWAERSGGSLSQGPSWAGSGRLRAGLTLEEPVSVALLSTTLA